MEILKQQIITLNFVDEEVSVFEELMIKLLTEAKKPGFKKLLNKVEIEMITGINEYLKGEKSEN